MPVDEGYIKFDCVWHPSDFDFSDADFQALSRWRSKLHALDLIGVYENGIGFGNISIRTLGHQLIITGSATGGKSELSQSDYALVTGYQIDRNRVECMGRTKASSEAMSHACLYESSSEIEAVIHVHHLELWQALSGKIPTTHQAIAFGTPDMAREIARLYRQSNLPREKILVMGGHREGLMAFGRDLDQAGETLLSHYRQYIK